MENVSYFDRLSHWARHSVTLKLFAIGFLILILLIPSSMVSSLIYERESTRNEAVREVSSKWGSDQQISGPVVSVPYVIHTKDKEGNSMTTTRYAHFLPDQIKINGTLLPEKRYRGIYVVVLYHAKLKIEGSFGQLNTTGLQIPEEDLRFQDALLTMGITDMKGIRKNIQVTLDDSVFNFEPGIPVHDIFSSGVSVPLYADPSGRTFSMELELNGSSSLSFLPLGRETDVSLASSWGNPSFEGSFLPVSRNISDSGFSASWAILELNRNYPQQGTGSFIHGSDDRDDDFGSGTDKGAAFGVKLLLPVDEYQKTMRSSKYCLMFIIITFLSFFFVEVFTGKKMHPVQYLLVGFAVVLFYILLLSVSEHLSFNSAYGISCVSILVLVTFYSWFVFRNRKVSFLILGLLSLLYGFFYSLLQLQDYALLMGSSGMLLILATIMYITRNINWYRLGHEDKKVE